jgi:hypothetical protein
MIGLLSSIFFILLGVYIGLLWAPYTQLDEKLRSRFTKSVIDKLKEEGYIE